jgi:GntR family transcriptional regulator
MANDLRGKIKEQKYTYGQKLPYEYVLCMNYHCNKETRKKALDILVKEGLIVRRRGAGTFAKDYDPSKDSANAKYAIELYRGHDIKSEVITFEVIPCDEKIAKKLQIEEGSFVYHIIRFCKINERPFNIEIIYMPISIIPSIKVEHLQSSIYKYIEQGLQLKI